MKILSVLILTSGTHQDRIYLHTDLPPCIWPYKEPASLRLDVAAGQGAQYVATNFPDIPTELLNLP